MAASPLRRRRSTRTLRTEIELRLHPSEHRARSVIEHSPVGAFAALLVEWKVKQGEWLTQEAETSYSAYYACSHLVLVDIVLRRSLAIWRVRGKMATDLRKSHGPCSAFAPLLLGVARSPNSFRTISSRTL
jgi:hypothetical protein